MLSRKQFFVNPYGLKKMEIINHVLFLSSILIVVEINLLVTIILLLTGLHRISALN